MKKLLLILSLLCCQFCHADIIINKDTTVNNTWVIPKGQIIRFESGGHIHGTGMIYGGIIQAAKTQWILDTTLTVIIEALYQGAFSAAWFGAHTNNADNYNQIQKSISTVISNYGATKELVIPKGTYTTTKSLKIASIYKGMYAGVTIHLFGEGGHWETGMGTTIRYTGTAGFAIGIQVGKGVEIDHLALQGMFKPPLTKDTVYYNTIFQNFEDTSFKCSFYLTGLSIDYDGSLNWSGSTALNIHDIRISGFSFLIACSPNGFTPNAEGLIIENIAFGDGRIGFANGQAQEKCNTIRNFLSWGRLHTLFFMGYFAKSQAGNYYIEKGDIAGKNVRILHSNNSGWYTTTMRDVFAESIGSVGAIYSQLPVEISNCTFHFEMPSLIGYQILVTTNNVKIKFNTCIFRYYGTNLPMKFSGLATYQNCFFSGAPINPVAGVIYN